MNNEKISIIMGIFNCADTLPEAIDSIIAQTYTDWELIMCDDCSTDDTYKVAEEYKNKYPEKIILVRNEVNSRLAFSLNHCLKYADGDFIARMDGDDISVPERFEIQVDYLINHPEYDMVGCAMQRFSDKGGLADINYAVDNPDYYTLKSRIPFNHATIVARRKVFDTIGGYTVCERTQRCEDHDLWFHFYKAGFKGYNLRDALYMVREDAAAIRRRTAKTRYYALKTTYIGFKMLGYPKRWLIKPTLRSILKSITPYKIAELYRKWQSKKKYSS